MSVSAVSQLARLLRLGGGVALIGGTGLFVNSEFLYNVDGGERVVIFDRFRGIVPDVSAYFLLLCWKRKSFEDISED